MVSRWIASRMAKIESSGIRKIFELARSIKDPINLSLGLPDFDVPEEIREAAKRAIDSRKNAYTVTQGIPALREKLLAIVQAKFPGQDRDLVVTSGTSGGLVLALMSVIDPGDEVIVFDPYFVMYPHLVSLAGGVPVFIDTYPDFSIDPGKVQKAITPKTKAILFNNPANPTGKAYDSETMKALAVLAKENNLLLVSDEVYSAFHYDGEMDSPANYNPDVLVVDGFSKSCAMTGWRVGFAHGPPHLIQEMIKLQQFTFVCSPSPFQEAALEAVNFDTQKIRESYSQKLNFMISELQEDYEINTPGGAFYIFPKAPGGQATRFVERALQEKLMVIPGITFSRQDTHFRLSYATSQETLEKGVGVLRKLARQTW
ncbi:MAG: aminotransferase class I/II-fold pyridoxal phosphate-dependent enzyme [Gemmataceae bacterium]|nr:aminotransferase class I/II-fold pyridoxal phosphate-dependent enzyme [Gemmataceae bacterium]